MPRNIGVGSRPALYSLPEASGLPRPEKARIAVFDGQFFGRKNFRNGTGVFGTWVRSN
ncbi:MAG: hypothetical protein ACOY40_05595 [Bacillota bacterium]